MYAFIWATMEQIEIVLTKISFGMSIHRNIISRNCNLILLNFPMTKTFKASKNYFQKKWSIRLNKTLYTRFHIKQRKFFKRLLFHWRNTVRIQLYVPSWDQYSNAVLSLGNRKNLQGAMSEELEDCGITIVLLLLLWFGKNYY